MGETADGTPIEVRLPDELSPEDQLAELMIDAGPETLAAVLDQVAAQADAEEPGSEAIADGFGYAPRVPPGLAEDLADIGRQADAEDPEYAELMEREVGLDLASRRVRQLRQAVELCRNLTPRDGPLPALLAGLLRGDVRCLPGILDGLRAAGRMADVRWLEHTAADLCLRLAPQERPRWLLSVRTRFLFDLYTTDSIIDQILARVDLSLLS
jgi:hypothetical protein